MSILLIKLIFAAIIFVIGLTAGLLPIKLMQHQRMLSIGDAFASGVFLSAALLHMLPDAESSFYHIVGSSGYPYAQLICLAVFVLLLLIERGALASGHTHMTHYTTPYLLALVLSIHSFVAGAALGITNSLAGMVIIFLAIVAHKGSAGFALSTNLQRYALPVKKITKIILLFAIATPVGILLASITKHMLHTNSGALTEAIFNACAAGTFLYLGTVHSIIEPKLLSRWPEVLSIILGATIMALVAIWL